MKTYPLHEAVLKSDAEAAVLAISQGADLNELDDDGQSPLHWAVLRGDDETVKLLLEMGADPNVMSDDGFTPKWSAVDFGLQNIKHILTTYGGIVSTNDRFDRKSWGVFKEIILEQPMPKEEKKRKWFNWF